MWPADKKRERTRLGGSHSVFRSWSEADCAEPAWSGNRSYFPSAATWTSFGSVWFIASSRDRLRSLFDSISLIVAPLVEYSARKYVFPYFLKVTVAGAFAELESTLDSIMASCVLRLALLLRARVSEPSMLMV